MWIVIYGRHFNYLDFKEFRYETPHWLFATVVYWSWLCRYSFSIYPVKYLKIYRNDKEVIDLRSYNKMFEGRYYASKQRKTK